MGDTFQCAKCGASYARERRRVGRAVVCACGHKFLVPPPDLGAPSADQPLQPGGRPLPRAPTSRAVDSDTSEVVPLAELIEPRLPPGRWAEPVEAAETAESLPEAEIVYASPAEPAYPADPMLAPGGPYGEPVDRSGGAPEPRRRSVPMAATTKRPRAQPANDERGLNVTYVVLFVVLPVFVLFCVLAIVLYSRFGTAVPEKAPPVATEPPDVDGDLPGKPAAGGLPILVVRVTKQPASDDFTMEYDVRHGSLNATSQYVWVVSAAQGKIEFQIPTPAPGRGHISGRPAQPSGLSPPFTAYIEEESGGARTRVSNEVAVAIGG